MRPSWVDESGNIDNKAYRRRLGENGLSVAPSHELAKQAIAKGCGVAVLEISSVEQLVGCPLVKDAETHGFIDGVPFDTEENYNLVMHFADKLKDISKFTRDPWKRG